VIKVLKARQGFKVQQANKERPGHRVSPDFKVPRENRASRVPRVFKGLPGNRVLQENKELLEKLALLVVKVRLVHKA